MNQLGGYNFTCRASKIVRRQEAFFLEADRPLKPMTLKEIADALSIHESTVSRAVNGKYLETTFGVFEIALILLNKYSFIRRRWRGCLNNDG